MPSLVTQESQTWATSFGPFHRAMQPANCRLTKRPLSKWTLLPLLFALFGTSSAIAAAKPAPAPMHTINYSNNVLDDASLQALAKTLPPAYQQLLRDRYALIVYTGDMTGEGRRRCFAATIVVPNPENGEQPYYSDLQKLGLSKWFDAADNARASCQKEAVQAALRRYTAASFAATLNAAEGGSRVAKESSLEDPKRGGTMTIWQTGLSEKAGRGALRAFTEYNFARSYPYAEVEPIVFGASFQTQGERMFCVVVVGLAPRHHVGEARRFPAKSITSFYSSQSGDCEDDAAYNAVDTLLTSGPWMLESFDLLVHFGETVPKYMVLTKAVPTTPVPAQQPKYAPTYRYNTEPERQPRYVPREVCVPDYNDHHAALGWQT